MRAFDVQIRLEPARDVRTPRALGLPTAVGTQRCASSPGLRRRKPIAGDPVSDRCRNIGTAYVPGDIKAGLAVYRSQTSV